MSYYVKHEEWERDLRLLDLGNATLEILPAFILKKFKLADLKPNIDI